MTKTNFALIISISLTTGIFGQDISYVADADIAFQNGEYKEAIDLYDKAVIENDNDDYTLYLRGVSKFKTSDYAGAIADFTKAIDLSPIDKSQAWSCDKRMVKYGASYTVMSNNISLVHKYYHAYFYRGQAKFELRDYRGAIVDFDKVLSVDKEMASAYNMRGLCKYNLNNFEGAKQDFSNGIRLNLKDGQAYYYRAVCYLNLSQKEQACKDLSRAGELGISYAYGLIKDNCN